MKKLGIALLVTIALLGMYEEAFGAPSGNAGKLIITEVAFRATGGDWIELYVVDGSVDWSGYRIYKGITLRFTIPATWETNGLTTGDYIVLHDEIGTDDVDKSDNNSGYWDGYMSGGFYNTDDIVQIKEPSGSTARVDAVIWSDNDESFTGSAGEANGAVADGMWNSYDFSSGDAGAWTDSDSIDSIESLARYLDSGTPVYADSNSKSDWYEETSPTEGQENNTQKPTAVTLSTFTAHSPAPQPAFFRWQWLALAIGLVLGGGAVVRRLLGR